MVINKELHNRYILEPTDNESALKFVRYIDKEITKIINSNDQISADRLIWKYLVKLYTGDKLNGKETTKSLLHKLLTINGIIDDKQNNKLNYCDKLKSRTCMLVSNSFYSQHKDITDDIISGICCNLSICLFFPDSSWEFLEVTHNEQIELDDSVI